MQFSNVIQFFLADVLLCDARFYDALSNPAYKAPLGRLNSVASFVGAVSLLQLDRIFNSNSLMVRSISFMISTIISGLSSTMAALIAERFVLSISTAARTVGFSVSDL
jgi:hypothetical protein